MGTNITYARALRIYEIPGCNPSIIKADVLITDGVVEHYDWQNRKDRKEILKLIDSCTKIIDERKDASWESLCRFYGSNQ